MFLPVAGNIGWFYRFDSIAVTIVFAVAMLGSIIGVDNGVAGVWMWAKRKVKTEPWHLTIILLFGWLPRGPLGEDRRMTGWLVVKAQRFGASMTKAHIIEYQPIMRPPAAGGDSQAQAVDRSVPMTSSWLPASG